MPKEKEYKGGIAAIYKRNYEDIAMFHSVEAQRQIVPSISIERGIENFFRRMGIRNFNADSAFTTYNRMKREFYDEQKEVK